MDVKLFFRKDFPEHGEDKFFPGAYLPWALGITTVIGDLFIHDLLPVMTVHKCLSILLAKFSTTHHLHAIHLLLLHANKGAWQKHDIDLFLTTLTWHADCLHKWVETKNGEASPYVSLDTNIRDGECESGTAINAWTEEIVEMVRRWQAVPTTRSNLVGSQHLLLYALSMLEL